jgi:hypothetical protein
MSLQHRFRQWAFSDLGTAVLSALLPLWCIGGCLVAGACVDRYQRRRRLFILLWILVAFFAVPVMGGIVFGVALGYAITHGTALAVSPAFVIGCSISALFFGRVGYVMAFLGWLPGTKAA